MKRFSVVFSMVFCASCLFAVGCGSGGPTTTTGDELSNFIADNPEIIEETNKYQSDPFDDSFEEDE